MYIQKFALSSQQIRPNRLSQRGFTLLELMVVVAVIALLVIIAYPMYQNYITSTRRSEMMVELQDRAALLESRKLSAGRGGYKNVSQEGLTSSYPAKNPLYTVSISGLDNNGRWQFAATPIAGTAQAKDGALTLRFDGEKCRGTKCGMGDEWRKN